MLALAGTLIFASCTKDDTNGNALSYQLQTTSHATALQNSTSVVAWTSGSAFVKEIEFEAESEDKEIEYQAQINKRVNLFDPIATLGTIHVPAGFYEEIAFEVEIKLSAGEPAMVLNGNFVKGAQTIPVVLKVNEEVEIEVERENIRVEAGTALTVINTYHLSRLMRGITETMMSNATRNASGQIEISSSMNASLYNIIKANLNDMGEVEID